MTQMSRIMMQLRKPPRRVIKVDFDAVVTPVRAPTSVFAWVMMMMTDRIDTELIFVLSCGGSRTMRQFDYAALDI